MIRTQTTADTQAGTHTRIQTTVDTRRFDKRLFRSPIHKRLFRTHSYTVGMFHSHSDTDCMSHIRSRNSHADTRVVPPCDERPQCSVE